MSYKRLEISAFGGPKVLRIAEVTTLPEPDENEVRIKEKGSECLVY